MSIESVQRRMEQILARMEALFPGSTARIRMPEVEFQAELARVKGWSALMRTGAPGAIPAPVSGEQRPSAKLQELATSAARANGLDPDLVSALIQAESGWNPRAVSPDGAMGLMQLMPATARHLGVTDPFDAEQNLTAGARHLSVLVQMYGGDVEKALAAYNAGTGAVDKYGGIPPYPETLGFVRQVMENMRQNEAAP